MKFLKHALFAAVTCFVAGAVLYAAPASRKEFRLRISGTAGLALTGYYEVEGRRSPFQGTIPTEVKVTARSLEYAVRKASEDGELKIELLLDGVPRMSASTASPGGGIRGAARRRLLSQSFWTHAFSEAPQRGVKPPRAGPAR